MERNVRAIVLSVGLLFAAAAVLLALTPPPPMNVAHRVAVCGVPPLLQALDFGDSTYCAAASRQRLAAAMLVLVVGAAWTWIALRVTETRVARSVPTEP